MYMKVHESSLRMNKYIPCNSDQKVGVLRPSSFYSAAAYQCLAPCFAPATTAFLDICIKDSMGENHNFCCPVRISKQPNKFENRQELHYEVVDHI